MAETRGRGRQKITRAKESQTQLEGLPENLAGKPFLVVGEHQATSTPKLDPRPSTNPTQNKKKYKTIVKKLENRPVHSQMRMMQVS